MERYHIFRLGLAILFYAAYCVRPMMMNELEINDPDDRSENKTKYFLDDEYVYYQGVQGKPGVDFPILSHIPKTSFNCKNMESGYYADLETDCQVFHICEEGKKISFLCPNGTIFQQSELICEWWFKVDCDNSPNLYEESAEQLRENNARRKASRRVKVNQNNFGAVMRTEEHASVTTSRKGQNFEIVIKQSPGRRPSNKNYYELENTKSTTKTNIDTRNDLNLAESTNVPPIPKSRKTGHVNFIQRDERPKTNTSPPEKNDFGGRTKYKSTTETIIVTEVSRKDYDEHLRTFNNEAEVTNLPPIENRKIDVSPKDEAKIIVQSDSDDEVPQYVNIRVNSKTVDRNNVNIRGNNVVAQQSTTPKPVSTTKSQNIRLKVSAGFGFNPNNFKNTNQANSFQNNDKNGREFTVGNTKQNKISNKQNNEESQKQKSTADLTINDITNKKIEPSDSEESQITQETGSFYKNSFNSLPTSYKPNQFPNHRETYSEIKEPSYYTTKYLSAISSVTPQYLTTQPINNGKPFIGSQVGTTAKQFTSTTPASIFNLGQTNKTLPPITTTTTKTYPIPTGTFNTGSIRTEKTIHPLPPTPNPNSLSLDLEAPAISSLNIGHIEVTTKRIIDQATVYGKFVKSSPETSKLSQNFNNLRSTPSKSVEAKSTIAPRFNSGFYVTKHAQSTTEANTITTFDNFKFEEKVQKPRPFKVSTAGSSYLPRSTTKSLRPSTDPVPTLPTYKISSASPFSLTPTEPTPPQTKLPSTFENVDSMINVLAEMAHENEYATQTPRPGLVIPPSAGPQTLHTLAVYFANALNGIATENQDQPTDEKEENLSHLDLEKKRLTKLLTQMTMDRYNELFSDKDKETTTSSPQKDDLETQHSLNPAQTESPRVRQLAKVFTQALSSYLDDPVTFRKVLQEVRPTEPPSLETEETPSEAEDELLNFSDADAKSSYPPIFPTPQSLAPTWGYILALNNSQNFDVKNSISNDENLQLADSQSFIPGYNQISVKDKNYRTTTELPKVSTETTNLPNNHWTSSPDVTKLWKNTFAFDPASLNHDFSTTEVSISSSEEDTEVPDPLPSLLPPFAPHYEIRYDLRAIPKVALNSTQVHGILIDFMNTTKYDDTNKLQRILRKLNTTEDEFLEKMKEIEQNPLTRRLILLLISECGTNVTKEVETQAVPIHTLINRNINRNKDEILETQSSIGGASVRQNAGVPIKSSSNFEKIVDSSLDEHAEDTRALQLLNSLYTIASKFGKK